MRVEYKIFTENARNCQSNTGHNAIQMGRRDDDDKVIVQLHFAFSDFGHLSDRSNGPNMDPNQKLLLAFGSPTRTHSPFIRAQSM